MNNIKLIFLLVLVAFSCRKLNPKPDNSFEIADFDFQGIRFEEPFYFAEEKDKIKDGRLFFSKVTDAKDQEQKFLTGNYEVDIICMHSYTNREVFRLKEKALNFQKGNAVLNIDFTKYNLEEAFYVCSIDILGDTYVQKAVQIGFLWKKERKFDLQQPMTIQFEYEKDKGELILNNLANCNNDCQKNLFVGFLYGGYYNTGMNFLDKDKIDQEYSLVFPKAIKASLDIYTFYYQVAQKKVYLSNKMMSETHLSLDCPNIKTEDKLAEIFPYNQAKITRLGGKIIGLDLSGKLRVVDKSISCFRSLETLDLSNNKLTELPLELKKIKTLKKLILKGNNFDLSSQLAIIFSFSNPKVQVLFN